MVYYGAVSKGCQNCRRRKVKCDQRKPSCLRCEKLGTNCSGYRNLSDVLFRDESQRIARRIQKQTREDTPSVGPGWPTQDLGVSFFFTQYTVVELPFSGDHRDWLVRTYHKDKGPLRASIDAVGLAGISNVHHLPETRAMSWKRYHDAINTLKHALTNPTQAIADTTLMAVILLALFETVNFTTWVRYSAWVSHVHGAMMLVKLRGRKQFEHPLGGLLYLLVRSQILLACLQQRMIVPPELVEATYMFQSSQVRRQWQTRDVATPGSLSEISIRVVNLRAIFKQGNSEPDLIRTTALGINDDLDAWEAVIPLKWRYTAVDATAEEDCYNRKKHSYPNLWVADAWNNWRAVRTVVHQILYYNETRVASPDTVLQTTALNIMKAMAIEICISVSSFENTPQVSSLIQPLFCVARNELNSRNLRTFAIVKLRAISYLTGIRKACLLADTAQQNLDGQARDFFSPPRVSLTSLSPRVPMDF